MISHITFYPRLVLENKTATHVKNLVFDNCFIPRTIDIVFVRLQMNEPCRADKSDEDVAQNKQHCTDGAVQGQSNGRKRTTECGRVGEAARVPLLLNC